MARDAVKRAMRMAIVALGAAAFVAAAACGSKTSADTAGPATTPCSPLSDAAVKLEYEAITTDGHYVVTFVPVGSAVAQTSRVFYGTPARMAEGRVTSIQNSCAHYVDFDVEGTSYSATFSGAPCSGVVPGRFSVIATDGGFVSQGLTIVQGYGDAGDAGVPASALTFVCL